jgi:hypothetical protein
VITPRRCPIGLFAKHNAAPFSNPFAMGPAFVPGPDPVVEAMKEAEALRSAGRLN